MTTQLRSISVCLVLLSFLLLACTPEKATAPIRPRILATNSSPNLVIRFGDQAFLDDMRLRIYVRAPYCVANADGHPATPDDLKQWILQDTKTTVYNLEVESATSASDLSFVVKQFENAAMQPNIHHQTVVNIIVNRPRSN